jgi:hypothetical protein
LAQALDGLVSNYSFFLSLFFFLGLGGSIIEVAFFVLKKVAKNPEKRKLSLDILINHKIFIISLLFSIIFSFLYSIIWPSGQIEPWMMSSIDFYSWLFISDYYLTGITETNILLTPNFSLFIKDSFGTYLIIALLSVINAKTVLNSAPFIVLTFITLLSTAIFTIINSKLKINYKYSLILTLGLTLSGFFHYIAIYGLFGQMTAMVLFLTSISQLNITNQHDKIFNFDKKLFLCLFTLLLSYQSGFFLYLSLLIFIRFILFILQNCNLKFYKNLITSLIYSAFPLLIIAVLSFLLMPGVAYHLFLRTWQVAQQVSGWPLPFLNPLFFSGLPFHVAGPFLLQYDVPEIEYQKIIFYFILLIFITINSIVFLKKHNLKNDNNTLLLALTITYLLSLLTYIGLYMTFGNIYRIWKLASFTALPLAFVPTTLIYMVMTKHHLSRHLLAGITSLIAVFFLAQIISSGPLVELPFKYYNIKSSAPFISVLNKFRTTIKDNTKLILHFNDLTKTFIATLALKTIPNTEISHINGLYYTPSHYDYFSLINNNSIIITSTNFNKIFNGSFSQEFDDRIFIYDFTRLNKVGYATLNSGINPFPWKINTNNLFIKIRLPASQINKTVKITATLSNIENIPEPCHQIWVGLPELNNEPKWSTHNIDDISIILSSYQTNNKFIQLIIYNENQNICSYLLNDINTDTVSNQFPDSL